MLEGIDHGFSSLFEEQASLSTFFVKQLVFKRIITQEGANWLLKTYGL